MRLLDQVCRIEKGITYEVVHGLTWGIHQPKMLLYLAFWFQMFHLRLNVQNDPNWSAASATRVPVK